jgi:hypothetical protein
MKETWEHEDERSRSREEKVKSNIIKRLQMKGD